MERLDGYQRERYESIKTNVVVAAVSIFLTATATYFITNKAHGHQLKNLQNKIEKNDMDFRKLNNLINNDLKQARKKTAETQNELIRVLEDSIKDKEKIGELYGSFEHIEGLIVHEILSYADADKNGELSQKEMLRIAKDLGCGEIKGSIEAFVLDVDPLAKKCSYSADKIKYPHSADKNNARILKAASINVLAKRAADYVSRHRGDR